MKLVVNSAYGYLGGRRRPDALRRRARRQRGDAPRPRDARPDVPRARRARRDAARGRHRRRVLRGARDAGPRPTSGASSPRSPRCCRRSCSSSSTAATPRCCRTSRRTTRCSAYDGTLLLRGVAFRSSRAEPFGEAFLRRAIARLLAGDVAGVRDAYLDDGRRAAPPRAADARRVVARAADARRRREYLASPRAAAASCRTRRCSRAAARRGRVGERVRVYRTADRPRRAWCADPDDDGAASDARRSHATTTSTTTCACCATPSPRGSPARSRRTTSRPSSPIPISCRSSRRRSPRSAPCSHRWKPRHHRRRPTSPTSSTPSAPHHRLIIRRSARRRGRCRPCR